MFNLVTLDKANNTTSISNKTSNKVDETARTRSMQTIVCGVDHVMRKGSTCASRRAALKEFSDTLQLTSVATIILYLYAKRK